MIESLRQMIEARDAYIGHIKAELLGPGSEFSVPDSEHELISSSPVSRYSVGILYPQNNRVSQDNDEVTPIFTEDDGTEPDREDFLATPASEDDADVSRETKHSEPDETADENLDEEINLSTQYLPSSLGITFLVKGNASRIVGKVEFATYRNTKVPDCVIPYIPPSDPERYTVPSEFAHKMIYDHSLGAIRLLEAIQPKEIRTIWEHDTLPEAEAKQYKQIAYRFVDFMRTGYVREPHHAEFMIDFKERDFFDDCKIIDGTSAKITALRTKVGDAWSITVMLVNESKAPVKAIHCLFQPQIIISSDCNDFGFVESNPNADISIMDEEECSLDLLYRSKKIYCTGLGASSDWSIDSDGCGSVWSDLFPQTEIPPMNFDLPDNDVITGKQLSMKYFSDLCTATKEDKLLTLTHLVRLYERWIDGLRTDAKSLNVRYLPAATANIVECQKACKRMFAGIDTLRSDEKAYDAFQLANRAMFMQRVHLRMQGNDNHYPGDPNVSEWLRNMDYRQESDSDCIWRPFQIAFLLMDVNSVTSDSCDERDMVDLIWFPTGGGKTEAYLGLTAFTIFYRRLAHAETSDGTAVMMRYTLRLLAAQQFTRAATLICACEVIRKDCESRRPRYPRHPLGSQSVTIGLWIGSSHIPNRNEDAKTHLDKLRGINEYYRVRSEKDRHNKFQVLKCPWCGTKLVKDDVGKKLVGGWGYSMRDGKSFYLHCTHEDCDFISKLPIQIIDEELYKQPPTLLFGTVDKFAMLPWDGRIGAFFAVDKETRTPELIIQDELHLISGALGTMVGLYETAVDALCSRKGIRPKIIASTATIRRAKEQCSVLYNRNVVQFPSPGLDAADSFFARERNIDHDSGVFGRMYVGIMPSGKTKAMTEIRSMAAMLQKTYTMSLPDTIRDKFWTLTVYFNSLKDLGKASTLVDDDVKDFIVRTANRMFEQRRLIIGADELTSRVTTTELNETLDKLEKREYSRENIDKRLYASSVLLATNMISVGIDVARLNVMLMVGQPKLTSEYIQASSRIGRQYPGVAFVQYDSTKSRDRSHYERFKAYHDSFYRFVEPTGATPFSKPSRERALHAVLTAMFRNAVAGFGEDKDAALFDLESFSIDIGNIKAFVIERIVSMTQRADNGLANDIDEIGSEIDTFFAEWQNIVDSANEEKRPFFFGRRYMVNSPKAGEFRLLRPYNKESYDAARNTLTSMRNVDTAVKGSVVIWEDEE